MLIIVVIVFLVFSRFPFSLSGKKQCRGRPVGLGDEPDFFERVRKIRAQEPETVLQAELIFFAVLFVEVAPSPAAVPSERFAGLLSCFL